MDEDDNGRNAGEGGGREVVEQLREGENISEASSSAFSKYSFDEDDFEEEQYNLA